MDASGREWRDKKKNQTADERRLTQMACVRLDRVLPNGPSREKTISCQRAR